MTRDQVKHIRFVDDTMGRKDLEKLCKVMLEVGTPVPWTSFVRADALDETGVRRLEQARCHTLQLGLEAGDDRILRAMKKQSRVDQYRHALKLIDRCGLNVRACFFIGFPGEDQESVDNLISFLNKVPSSGPSIFEYAVAPFFLLPLSPIYTNTRRKKHRLTGYLSNWNHATMSSTEAIDHIRRVFLGVNSDACWCYTGDMITPAVGRRRIKEVKLLRQTIQREMLLGVDKATLSTRWDQLEAVVLGGDG